VFATGKPFQDSIVFAGRARAYSNGAPFKDSTLKVFYYTYLKTLDWTGKACRGQTLAYYEDPYITVVKSFITLALAPTTSFILQKTNCLLNL
jgi:hypothetical protein